MTHTDTHAGHASLDEMGLDEAEIARRRLFLEFSDEDVARLRGLHEQARGDAGRVIDRFYDHLMRFDETREFFRDARVLERVKRAQTAYFLQLTEGVYDKGYMASRVRIGFIHQRINLPLKAYFGAYNLYLREVAHRFFPADDAAHDRAEAFLSLLKLVFMDISLAIEGHTFLRERTIREQAEVIHDLSTPVLRVRDGLLIAPIIGTIDTARARQLTEQLLHAIRVNRARVVVMDITGVAVVDSNVANHLIQTVQAARLMGARVIITGISSEIAQTLVRIGVDLAQFDTVGDLQEGIEVAERLLGYSVVRDASVVSAAMPAPRGG
ncbi:MAG: protoglobin domain-containing protein [Deltaproteobacteria bacterium]